MEKRGSNQNRLFNPKELLNIEEASKEILQILSDFIPINTFFVAVNDRSTNYILKVLNRQSALILEGTRIPFEDAY
ncbi:hypothetical protein [Halalkalibacter nanhaiisediminis]|uniref:RsbT co-antagonist protein RsbR n=1 Tax=Halalkalibacter nanhaiisediminis TaxID=688079 RepID=A0A562QKJ2_9BACI|nr:hypothetical protein [Halalkalibacter nanhaiisediminis]TWI57225.1 rsbT co-antagonist protein RsbR [Halalkalibacter nanhaiisediminis]